MGDNLFHPRRGDLSDPDTIDGEEGNEGLDKEFDKH